MGSAIERRAGRGSGWCSWSASTAAASSQPDSTYPGTVTPLGDARRMDEHRVDVDRLADAEGEDPQHQRQPMGQPPAVEQRGADEEADDEHIEHGIDAPQHGSRGRVREVRCHEDEDRRCGEGAEQPVDHLPGPEARAAAAEQDGERAVEQRIADQPQDVADERIRGRRDVTARHPEARRHAGEDEPGREQQMRAPVRAGADAAGDRHEEREQPDAAQTGLVERPRGRPGGLRGDQEDEQRGRATDRHPGPRVGEDRRKRGAVSRGAGTRHTE